MAFLTMFGAFYLALVAYRVTEAGYQAVMRRSGREVKEDPFTLLPRATVESQEPSLDGVTADSPTEGEKEDGAQKQEQRPYGFVW